MEGRGTIRVNYTEFHKAKPLTFDGEIRTSQEAKAWVLGMLKWFQLHNYSEELKTRVTIYNLIGNASLWWEHHRQIKQINDKKTV
jgi:hypothetical protein